MDIFGYIFISLICFFIAFEIISKVVEGIIFIWEEIKEPLSEK